MGLCESLGKCYRNMFLFIINLIDACLAVIFISYASFLAGNNYAPPWMYGMIFYLGFLFAFVVASSIYGEKSSTLGCWLVFSAWLGLLLGVSEMVLGITIMGMQDRLDEFLNEHQQELKLSNKLLQEFKTGREVFGYSLMFMMFLQLGRFLITRQVKMNKELAHGDQGELKAAKRAVEQTKDRKKKKELKSRYDEMRIKFKQKHGFSSV